MHISERLSSADFTEFPAGPQTWSAVSIHPLFLGISWFWYQSQHETQLKWLSLTYFVYCKFVQLWMSGGFKTVAQAQFFWWTQSGIEIYERAQRNLIASSLHTNIALCVDVGPDSLCQLLLSASPSDNSVLCSFRLPHISSWKNFNSFNSLFQLQLRQFYLLWHILMKPIANIVLLLGVLTCFLQEQDRIKTNDCWSLCLEGDCECCQTFIMLGHFIALKYFIMLSMANFPLSYKCNPSLLNMWQQLWFAEIPFR